MATFDDHARAGVAAVNERRFNDAIDHFEKALEIEPDRPDVRSALGMAYVHRGEAATGLPHIQRALELASDLDDAEHGEMKLHFHLGLATAHELLEQVDASRAVLERAIAQWPEALDPRLQLGQLLLSACRFDDGMAVYRALAGDEGFPEDARKASRVVVESIDAWLDAGHGADMFLRAHQAEYKRYFDEVAEQQVREGWYAEAARMARGDDGEVRPVVTEGARSYALTRVDLVNPRDGGVANVYDEQDPMVVALNGLEPLAQIPVMLPWEGHPFQVWVCSRCPWHWLSFTVQFDEADTPEALIEAVDPTVGDWYLAGFNGDFGDRDSGRFHYVTDPDTVGDRGVSYVFDLGRASFEAVPTLLNRLAVLHEKRPIRRVLFGQGRLPD